MKTCSRSVFQGKLRLSGLAVTGWAVLALACGSAQALPLITSVVETGGDDEATDTVRAKFTGETFSNGVSGEFLDPFTVPFFDEGVPHMVDRTHQHVGASAELPLPDYLVGGEYIMIGNDNRDNPDFQLEVTISASADVYLLIDNRRGGSDNNSPPALDLAMLWVVADGWEPVLNGLNRRGDLTQPDETGVDENADGSINQWNSVYHKRMPAGTFVLYQADGAGQNMYGVVVKAVPSGPYVSGSSGDLLGVFFDIANGETSDLAPATIRLSVDGTDVTAQAQVSTQGDVTRVRYRPAEPFVSQSEHVAVLTFSDDATPSTQVTNTLEFTVEYYATLTAADAAPEGSVDTAASGFTARIVQARDTASWPGADLPNNTLRGELQLAGLIRDPVTGEFLENFAVPGSNPDGTYTVERINWNQEFNGGTLVEVGRFQSTSTPPFPDEPIPGIPGTDPDSGFNIDNIAGEIIGYLDLDVGVYRFGVNSDDGFRVTAGPDPSNPNNVVLGEFSGGRGSSDTLFYVKVDDPGIYPVRLIWYEGGGGANLEFFSVHQPDPDQPPEYIPVNTRDHADGITSYARSSASLPPAASVYPLANSTGVPADAPIQAVLMERGSGVAAGSAQLTVNGAPAQVTTSQLDTGLLVEHRPADLWPSGSTNTAVLTFGTTTGGNVEVAWTFVVEDYSGLPVIPAGYAVAPGSVNTSSSGFIVDMYQMLDSVTGLPLARSGFADNNSSEAAEHQIQRGFIDPLTGEPYPNYANPGENADGTHNVELINWNQQIANAGDFHSGTGFDDALIPGLYFDGDVPENNWIVAEAVGYLELTRGRHRFGVNSDDGFKVTTAPNPRDQVGLQLGLFNTGRGAANTFFDFIVEEDGIYPFRLLWWEGTGGASLEFKSQDPIQLSQSLINDRARATAIKAYRTFTGTPLPRIVSVSPPPGGTDVATDAAISVGLENLGNTAVQLRINGSEVTPERTTADGVTTLTYLPDEPFPPGSRVDVELVRSGTTSSWSYTVGSGAENLLAVTLTSPLDGARFSQGPTNITLMVDVTVSGGTVTRVEFFDGASNKVAEATAAPFQAVWSGVLPGRHSLTARATDDRGLTASSARIGFQVGEPIAVNFQAATADVPEGYLPDFGDVYGDRGNGYSYGWDEDNTVNARDRNDPLSPDERYDTFNHWQKPAPAGTLWEIEVPNGRYNVYAVAGEPSNIDSAYDVQAEGVTIVQGIPTDAVRWFEGTGAVTVSDGRLSIGNGPGAANNKVCFVEIYALPEEVEGPALQPPTVADGNITITWTGGGELESADSVTGPWTGTGDSDGSYSAPVSGERKFFRVRR